MWPVQLFVIITIALLAVYSVLMYYYNNWFRKLKPFMPGNSFAPTTSFSVIIPARNEEAIIAKCLESVLNNNYPKHLFEVIVVDDFSEDETPRIVTRMQQQHENLQLIQLKELLQTKLNSYKKKAIETAIAKATGDWIITTDADCTIKQNWLQLYAAFIQQTSPVFVAAPVMFLKKRSFVGIFQILDFLSLQGITAASVANGFLSMCNGANLAYKKEAFYAVEGFKNIDNLASGDDMFLMQKMQQLFPGKTGYLFSREAVVITEPMHNWKNFFNQRIRWASKASSYTDKRIFYVLLLVYLLNLFLLAMPFVGLFYKLALVIWLLLLLLKVLAEFPFMWAVASFYKVQNFLWWFPVMQPVHIFYTVVAGWLGKFGKYQWKGRTVQ